MTFPQRRLNVQVRRPTKCALSRSLPFAKRYLLQRQQSCAVAFFILVFLLVSPLFSPLSSAAPSGTGHARRSCRSFFAQSAKKDRSIESDGAFLAAARSRLGSDVPPAHHSLPRRRFATPRTPLRLYSGIDGGLRNGGRYVIIITIQKTDCILGKPVLICTKGNTPIPRTTDH